MESVKVLFVVLPGLILVLGLVLVGLSLGASFRRRGSLRGWVETSATVTGNLHGKDGPASNGSQRFAPSYEFKDASGQRWLGQSDIYGADQEIIGTAIPVLYNPANPAAPNQSFQVASESKMVIGCLMPVFAFFALLLFWVAGAFPVG